MCLLQTLTRHPAFVRRAGTLHESRWSFGAAGGTIPLILCCLVLGQAQSTTAGSGELTVNVVDAGTGEPIACRMHLMNAKQRPQKAAKMPFWHDHFVFPGTVKLKLPRGNYTFVVERGAEYVDMSGYFTINDFADDEKTIELKRAVNMADEGWWSGDLHIHRPVKDIELLMRAEDLHVAPVITWWNAKNEWTQQGKDETVKKFDGNRYYDISAGEDEREGGALLYFRLPGPLPITNASREFPSPMEFLLLAREKPRAWIDVEKPFWWDVPVWLASGKVDSIGVCNNHMCRDQMYANEAWGRPRDKKRLPDPLGNGRWTQEIYYHVLNCGLRIPPSAGSASGVLPNPVGYNRVYVWVDKDQFSYDAWWEAFKAGRVVVTNGPLLRPLADGRFPGHVFQSPSGDPLTIDVVLNLTIRETISYIELVKDGKVVQSVRYEDLAKTGHFPPLKFEESGWFLVRALTDNQKTYRFASSGPWYVEIGDTKQRISKKSARFFLDWVNERIPRVKLDNADERRAVLKFHEEARDYWQGLLSRANAE